jgi:hypothetical protein
LHKEAVAPTPTPATEQRPSSQRAKPALEGVLDLGVEADGARELAVVVEVVFTPPTGQKMDERYGPARFMVISASPPELLVDGAGNATDLERTIVIADPRQSGITSGVLHVSARCASCDDPDAEGAAEFPACHVHQQDWGVPIVITDNGTNSLELMLAGRSA